MKKAKKILTLVACAVLLVCISVGATIAYLTATTEVVENTFTVGDVKFFDDPTTELDEGLTEADVNDKGEVLDDKGNVKDPQPADDKLYEESVRVQGNEYKLMPGHTYVKDPTVKLASASEPAYVRMIVTISDIADVKAAIGAVLPESVVDGKFLPQYLVSGWYNDVWQSTGVITEKDNVATYEFRYVGKHSVNGVTGKVEGEGAAATVVALTADTVLEPLFTHIVMPDNIKNDGLNGVDKTVVVGKNDDGTDKTETIKNVIDLADLADMKIDVVAEAIQADGFADADAAWTAYANQQ